MSPARTAVLRSVLIPCHTMFPLPGTADLQSSSLGIVTLSCIFTYAGVIALEAWATGWPPCIRQTPSPMSEASHCSSVSALQSKYFKTREAERTSFSYLKLVPWTWSSHKNWFIYCSLRSSLMGAVIWERFGAISEDSRPSLGACSHPACYWM